MGSPVNVNLLSKVTETTVVRCELWLKIFHEVHAMATAHRHRVAMVCDFFYPSAGGVENHVHQLAQCLLGLGHKVVVITHKYGSRTGVRWLAGGLKVYHVPFASVYDRSLLPTAVLLMPLLRDILVREDITIVHAHAVCTMSLESVVLSALMGYRVVYTEHSNFGFSGLTDINLNKLAQCVLAHADSVISVSHTSKENVVLRCCLNPTKVFVIPNAVDASQFRPDPDNVRPKSSVNIIVMTRLVWRKGIHLLVQVNAWVALTLTWSDASRSCLSLALSQAAVPGARRWRLSRTLFLPGLSLTSVLNSDPTSRLCSTRLDPTRPDPTRPDPTRPDPT